MGLLFALSLPGLVCLLILLATIERLGRGRGSGGSSPLSATGFEEVDAALNGAKRAELAARHSQSLLADDEESGAPPRTTVDLDAGVVRFRRQT
ncbi:hypothetical protein GCM10009836_51590 [Pseudonocardia ailaonensis]|uniref:Uncharacterized protein n=1 Tax=Pseudonocardia ailaonensis TaxID=367279 RepID=A0ABN2NER3_9PSEU